MNQTNKLIQVMNFTYEYECQNIPKHDSQKKKHNHKKTVSKLLLQMDKLLLVKKKHL